MKNLDLSRVGIVAGVLEPSQNALLAVIKKGDLDLLQDFLELFRESLPELEQIVAEAAREIWSENLSILPSVQQSMRLDRHGETEVLVLRLCSFTKTACRVLVICTDRRVAPRVFNGHDSKSGFIQLFDSSDQADNLMIQIGRVANLTLSQGPPPPMTKATTGPLY